MKASAAKSMQAAATRLKRADVQEGLREGGKKAWPGGGRAASVSFRPPAIRGGQPTSRLLIANGADADDGSRPSVEQRSCRRRFPDSTIGAPVEPISARTEPMARTPRCDWSDAAAGNGAHSATGNGATSEAAPPTLAPAEPPRPECFSRI